MILEDVFHTDHGGSKAEMSVPVTNDQATSHAKINV